MIIGFTGTQLGMTNEQKKRVAELLRPHTFKEFHHGACVGADEEAAMIAGNLGLVTVAHPGIDAPDKRTLFVSNRTLEAKPNLLRNRDIVDVCDLLLAAPHGHLRVVRSGTWYTVRYAERTDHNLTIIYPDGSSESTRAEEEEAVHTN